MSLPHLTRAQSRALDELAVSRYRMPSILLMENAARSAAVLAGRLLRDRPGEVLLLVGPGNNGGDALALARFLCNAGRSVTLALLSPDKPFTGDAAINHDIARAMNLDVEPASPALLARPVALIVDGLFGTGLTRPLDGLAAELALATHTLRQHRPDLPILALDLPSGLDADTGEPLSEATVKATHTITFAAPKVGFQNPQAHDYTGEITIGDIGIPRQALTEIAGS
jgi:NAD(P)H-hydrate epimerase